MRCVVLTYLFDLDLIYLTRCAAAGKWKCVVAASLEASLVSPQLQVCLPVLLHCGTEHEIHWSESSSLGRINTCAAALHVGNKILQLFIERIFPSNCSAFHISYAINLIPQ